jgi:hypothetical protein
MIYYFTPYEEGDLGKAYNFYCNLVPNDDDWITMMDGDIMHLNMDWGKKWQDIINQNTNAGLVTCMTNRVAINNMDQVCHEMYNETDIIKHRKYSIDLFAKNKFATKQMTGKFLSGYFFSFQKSTWKKVNGFKTNGILNIDSDFYNKVKQIKPCVVATGFYVLHYYRMMEGKDHKEHLKT